MSIAVVAFLIMTILTACGESRVFMSTSRLAANEIDQTVVSITLSVVDNSSVSPIEILDSPLEPGTVKTVSLPEKQAKNDDWEVMCTLEDGTTSNPLDVGNINPHGEDSRLTCFSVAWNESTGMPMMRAYFDGGEAEYGIYDPGDDIVGTIYGYNSEDDYSYEEDYVEYEEEYEDSYDDESTDGIDSYEALYYLNTALAYYGGDPDNYDLTDHYGEPQSVYTEDYSQSVKAWIFRDDNPDNSIYFYAVDLDGNAYVYDMTNGALISFETYAEYRED
jgi:hypothetical protein